MNEDHENDSQDDLPDWITGIDGLEEGGGDVNDNEERINKSEDRNSPQWMCDLAEEDVDQSQEASDTTDQPEEGVDSGMEVSGAGDTKEPSSSLFHEIVDIVWALFSAETFNVSASKTGFSSSDSKEEVFSQTVVIPGDFIGKSSTDQDVTSVASEITLMPVRILQVETTQVVTQANIVTDIAQDSL